jgi:hypothetical protein
MVGAGELQMPRVRHRSLLMAANSLGQLLGQGCDVNAPSASAAMALSSRVPAGTGELPMSER